MACSFLFCLKAVTRAGISPSSSSCLPTPCLSTDFISCSRFQKLLHFFQQWAQQSLIRLRFYLLSKLELPLKKIRVWVKRDFKLHWSQEINNKCSPSNLALPACHSGQHSRPFHHQLKWHPAARLHAAAIPRPAKPMSAPRANWFRTAGFSLSSCKWRFGSHHCASWCLTSLLSFPRVNFCLSKPEEKGRWWLHSHWCTSRKHVTEAKEIGLTLILSEQDSQYFKTLSNRLVKSSTRVESEAPDFSRGNWKNISL